MEPIKKPFYKRLWFAVLSLITLGIIALFLIPYGFAGRSIGSQLWDTVTQATELYVYDEKEHWTKEEWNDYWKKHPEYTANTTGTDWESFPAGSDPDNPLLDQLPPDYAKLWNIDFSDLEETEQYDAFLNKPILDEKGKPLPEEFIYREKSTGDLIVDVTLDGFILRLDPSYRAGWAVRAESDANGFNKFEKALNLQLLKNLGDKTCRIEIAPDDWTGSYTDKPIDHPEYKLTMRHLTGLDEPDAPRRFLRVKLAEAPYNTDTYAIRIDSISPKECFDANLELEVLKGMTFLPPELKRQGLDYDELHRFPIPYYWPKLLNEEVKLSEDKSSGKKIVEYDGYRLEVEPEWEIKGDDEEGIKIVNSRRCEVLVKSWKNWREDLKENNAKNLEEYYQIIGKEILKPEWGVESRSSSAKKVTDHPYETYKGEGIIDLGDGDKIINGGYTVKNKDKIVDINWTLEDPFEDVRSGECNAFGEAVFDGFSFLE